MLFASALTVTASLFQMPAEVPLPAGLERSSIHTVLQATETHFVAVNPTLESQLLVFGNAQFGMLSRVRVQPGQTVVFPFSEGASDDVWVEVVSPFGSGLRNTGAIPVDVLQDAAGRTVWIEAAQSYSVGWRVENDELRHVQPVGELLPVAGGRLASLGLRDFSNTSATHVPVISPNDDQRPPQPPKLDKTPLPPV